MSKPIGYYTDCVQAQNLVKRFGDHNLEGLPQVDQAALIIALAGMVLARLVGLHAVTVLDAAADCIPESYDYTSDEVNEAIAILEDVTPDEAIAIIQFLVQ